MLYKFYLYKYEKKNFISNGFTLLTVSDMMYVGSAELQSLEDVTEVFNSKLRQFLIDNKIKHFLPFNRPTIEESENECSICYYHDQDWYNFIYNSFADNPDMIMAPLITSIYDSKYHNYGLDDYWDPIGYPEIDLITE